MTFGAHGAGPDEHHIGYGAQGVEHALIPGATPGFRILP
jgi:hypothetical protein